MLLLSPFLGFNFWCTRYRITRRIQVWNKILPANNKISNYGRFYAKRHVLERLLLTLRSPPTPNEWLTPQNLYIFRKCIPWLYSSFLNFSKIFYSNKFSLYLLFTVKSPKLPTLTPTSGGEAWSPHFWIRMYPPIWGWFGSETLLQLSDHSLYFALVTQTMRLKW